MLERRGITLQKMEMPKQTRNRKLKVLEMPEEVCAFLITVVQFEILFCIKFYKNADFLNLFFIFYFYFLRRSLALYVVSTQNTSLLLLGEGANVTNRMSLKLD
uniref:Uncharacterized protein n=2 Tax=Pan TaxID=9596 RepID=A0A2I3RJX5_PANTR